MKKNGRRREEEGKGEEGRGGDRRADTNSGKERRSGSWSSLQVSKGEKIIVRNPLRSNNKRRKQKTLKQNNKFTVLDFPFS